MSGRRAPRRLVVGLGLALAALGQNAAPAAVIITGLEVRPEIEGVVIWVSGWGHQELGVTSFTLSDPPRLVLDLPDAVLGPGAPTRLTVGAAGCRELRAGQFQRDPPVVRLVLDLESDEAPLWRWANDPDTGRARLVVGREGPVALSPPTRREAGETVLIRFARVGHLARRVAALADPPRIYADLTGAVVERSCRQSFAEGPIREVRMAQQPDEEAGPVARLVVELAEETPHVVFTEGEDLVVALGPEPWAAPPPEYAARGRLKGRVIVVDPGHGGHDPGAPAWPGPPAEGPFEKDVVLDIGLRLARLARAEGASVTMTREDDRYITLQARAALANQLRADVFVSIHCNSCPTPNTLSGTSVYYDHEHSAPLAARVQEELVAALGTADQGVRSANFAVIRRTQGPGILVETAFINHEGDRTRLMHPSFRERAARAILQGVIRFLDETGR